MQVVKAFNKPVNYIILLGFVIVLGIVYFTMTDNVAMQSMLISVSFAYVTLLFISKIVKKTIDRKLLYIVLASIALVFFNVTLSGPGGFDYYKKAIMFSALLMWIAVCLFSQVSRKTVIRIYAINIIIAILYQLFYDQGWVIIDGEIYITLNFSNPNLAGIFVMNTLLYLAIFIVAGRAVFSRLQNIINLCIAISVFIAVFGLLMLTGNRSSILSVGIFVFLVLLDIIIKKKFWLNKLFCFAVAIIPFLFIFWYVTNAGDLDMDVTLGASGEGKSNTSRNHVWMPILENFFHFFLIGDYYGISGGTGFGQLHNTHLDVYASYGFAVFALFISFIYKVLRIGFMKSYDLFTRCGVYAFIATMGNSCFEASLVAGSAGFYLLTGGFLLISNYKPFNRIT